MRLCLRCGKDLTDAMGVQVFQVQPGVIGVGQFQPSDDLMCAEHGANGQNNLRPSELADLRQRVELHQRAAALPLGLFTTPDGGLLIRCQATREENSGQPCVRSFPLDDGNDEEAYARNGGRLRRAIDHARQPHTSAPKTPASSARRPGPRPPPVNGTREGQP